MSNENTYGRKKIATGKILNEIGNIEMIDAN